MKVGLAAAAVVALYGVLEHYGIDKHLWVQDVRNRVFSSLGQPNWLAAYLVALIPLPMAFMLRALRGDTEQKTVTPAAIMWAAVTVLFFVTLLFTRSRSGLLGFAVADTVFWIGAYLLTMRKRPVFFAAAVLHIVFFVAVFAYGTSVEQIDKYVTFQAIKNRITRQAPVPAPAPRPSGTLLEYGGTDSGKIREYVWQAAVTAWKASTKNFLVGTGTETFAWTFFRYRPKAHNSVSEWDFLYNKAHNEYLNYLATTGIFGLGSYLVMLGGSLWIFSWPYRKRYASHNAGILADGGIHAGLMPEPVLTSLFVTALLSGWLSVLVTNFFGFSVVIIQIFLFLFPAVVMVLLQSNGSVRPRFTVFQIHGAVSTGITVGALFFGSIVMLTLWAYWRADTLFASGYRYDRAGQYQNAVPVLQKAIALNGAEPLYHDELAGALAPLAAAAAQEKDATNAAVFAKKAIDESNLAVTTSPDNVNFWKTRTKVFYTFADISPEFLDAAIESLNRALVLSPNDPKLYYNLAILYGNKGDSAKALKLLTDAKNLKPDYRDAYYGLYVFYTQLKQQDKAKQELQDYLTRVDPTDRDFQDRLKAMQ